MKYFTLFLAVILLSQIPYNLHAQYGPVHCGASACDQDALDSINKGLLKKNRKDSIRCFHLYANYQYENLNNRDSAVYYLKKVHAMDDLYISKFYALEMALQEYDNRSTINYFFIRMNLPDEEEYLNREIIDQYIRQILDEDVDYDEFISSIHDLDQSKRENWSKLSTQINQIVDSLKNSNEELNLLNKKEEELAQLQSVNDSLARNLFIEKFNNDLDYFNKEFTNDEKSFLFAFFLHWGTNLIGKNDMLQKLVEKNVLSINQCMNIIGRCYCVRYNKSPFQSLHCDQDEALLPVVKSEFPFLYDLYKTEKAK